ncbi:hypothetical protein AGMMS49940_14360 [Spirochaetia bacterium]|nr:hypothetical protein AGMMS49940_14360 [Spirochaetia bacterium]
MALPKLPQDLPDKGVLLLQQTRRQGIPHRDKKFLTGGRRPFPGQGLLYPRSKYPPVPAEAPDKGKAQFR